MGLVIALAAPANASTVLWVGGTSGSLGAVLSQIFNVNASLLGGAYADDTITTVNYPAAIWPVTGVLDPTLGVSVAAGVANVETAVAGLSVGALDSLVLIGTSQGAMVVQQVAADLNADLSVPSNTTFVLIADPNFGLFAHNGGTYVPIFDYTPITLPETRFHTVVVINQYDGFADPITQPWNMLTVLNAVMGIYYVHAVAHTTDLSTVPAANITTTTNSLGGTTTTYFVPTNFLPLTMPLRQLGVPKDIVDSIDAQLRPIIDQGYAPLPSTQPAASSVTAALTPTSSAQTPTTPSTPAGAGATARKKAQKQASSQGGSSAGGSRATGSSGRSRAD
ncbi:PE-PPE domain-containing protein [Mycobacterium sp. DL592]|uniref:PE-PPE domain-containing protein n=1 Tax=Mycobacterium sp. DL592 TaxID=2675524 RepID=UPI00141EA386|nr:PE-PPE domain-containing protein [Mycobacterium sp. DL592]